MTSIKNFELGEEETLLFEGDCGALISKTPVNVMVAAPHAMICDGQVNVVDYTNHIAGPYSEHEYESIPRINCLPGGFVILPKHVFTRGSDIVNGLHFPEILCSIIVTKNKALIISAYNASLNIDTSHLKRDVGNISRITKEGNIFRFYLDGENYIEYTSNHLQNAVSEGFHTAITMVENVSSMDLNNPTVIYVD